MEQILDSQQAQTQSYQYGGFWIRFVAAFIDGLVVSIPNVLLTFIFFGSFMMSPDSFDMNNMGSLGIYYLMLFAIGWLYEAGMVSSTKQATLGKMAMGLKVTNLQGERIGFAQSTGRHFSKLLSTLLFCIGYLMIAFSDRKQGLHDKIASTYVVKN